MVESKWYVFGSYHGTTSRESSGGTGCICPSIYSAGSTSGTGTIDPFESTSYGYDLCRYGRWGTQNCIMAGPSTIIELLLWSPQIINAIVPIQSWCEFNQSSDQRATSQCRIAMVNTNEASRVVTIQCITTARRT